MSINRDVERHTVLAISTSHLSEEAARRLSAGDNPWVTCATFGCGVFIYPLEQFDDEHYCEPLPQCVRDICNWASQRGHRDWILLDCDAGCADDLPTYDW